MAGEENFFSRTWNAITSMVSSIARHKLSEEVTQSVTKSAGSHIASRIGSYTLGFGAGSAVNLYASWREYKQAENEMRIFFAPEIAAKSGKNPKDVTVDDLYEAAKTNPTIAEDIDRNKKRRNLNFGINTVALLVSVPVTAMVLGAVFGAPVVAGAALFSVLGAKILLAGMAVGLATFLAVEEPLKVLGKKMFGLNEPSINSAIRNLDKQRGLSLPSQIRALDRLQKRKAPITADHVMTAFLAADRDLDSHITSNYGKHYGQLSAETRAQIIREIGPDYRIEAIANDLGSNQMRAQEMAFMVHGQSSGMKLPEPKEAAPVQVAAVEEEAPSFTYRTRIIEERKQAQKAQEAAPSQGPIAAADSGAYRTMVIEERKAAQAPQQTSMA